MNRMFRNSQSEATTVSFLDSAGPSRLPVSTSTKVKTQALLLDRLSIHGRFSRKPDPNSIIEYFECAYGNPVILQKFTCGLVLSRQKLREPPVRNVVPGLRSATEHDGWGSSNRIFSIINNMPNSLHRISKAETRRSHVACRPAVLSYTTSD